MMPERPLPPDEQQDPLDVTPPDAEDEQADEEQRPTIEPDDAKPTEDPGISPI